MIGIVKLKVLGHRGRKYMNIKKYFLIFLGLIFLLDSSFVSAMTIQNPSVTMRVVGTFSSPITTASYNLIADNASNTILFYGATDTVNLPTAAITGQNIIIYNTGSFTITIAPASGEVIVVNGTAKAANGTFTLSSGVGNFVVLFSDGVRWTTFGYKGTLT